MSWLDAEKLRGLDASMRSKLANVLKELGANEPGDLAELEEADLADLSALGVEMKPVHKKKFKALIEKI